MADFVSAVLDFSVFATAWLVSLQPSETTATVGGVHFEVPRDDKLVHVAHNTEQILSRMLPCYSPVQLLQ